MFYGLSLSRPAYKEQRGVAHRYSVNSEKTATSVLCVCAYVTSKTREILKFKVP